MNGGEARQCLGSCRWKQAKGASSAAEGAIRCVTGDGARDRAVVLADCAPVPASICNL